MNMHEYICARIGKQIKCCHQKHNNNEHNQHSLKQVVVFNEWARLNLKVVIPKLTRSGRKGEIKPVCQSLGSYKKHTCVFNLR